MAEAENRARDEYLLTRWARMFSRRAAVNWWGAQYRLCEVGQRRLNPRETEDWLQAMQRRSQSPAEPETGLLVDWTLNRDDRDSAIREAQKHSRLLAQDNDTFSPGDLTQRLLKVARMPEERRRRTETLSSERVRRVLMADANVEVEWETSQLLEADDMLVVVRNDYEWLYPDDRRLWELLTAAKGPVTIVSRKIAPTTFVLFKALGVIGCQFYAPLRSVRPSQELLEAADELGMPAPKQVEQLRDGPFGEQLGRCIELARAQRRVEIREEPPTLENGRVDLATWTESNGIEMTTDWHDFARQQRATAAQGSMTARSDIERTDATVDEREGGRRIAVAAEVDRETWDGVIAKLRKN